MLNAPILAIKLFWREWRRGEWTIVVIALLLAITATTAINFYTDRVTRGLEQQSMKFLGGNLVVSSPLAIPLEWVKMANSLGLQSAEVWTYPSVISAKNQLQLVNVQAVSTTYPLISENPIRIEKNSIWIEPRLLPLLTIKLNDNLMLGAANFRVSKLLTSDVDSLNTGWAIAPRVLIRIDDLPATKTILPGSRIDYRLLLVGEAKELQLFRHWIVPQLKPGQRLLDLNTQEFKINAILKYAESYLQLIVLVCLMMSGVAIALSIQQYMRRHNSYVALWRCLGASKQQIMQIFFWQLLFVALTTGIIAVILGYIFQEIFANLFKEFLQFPLPATGVSPVLLGFFVSIFLLFAFSYPLISQLPRISPLFIWRNEIASHTKQKSYSLVVSIVLISAFIFWYMNLSELVFYFLDSVLLSIGFLYLLSIIILAFLKRSLIHTEGAIRRGLSEIVQHSHSISLQFIGFNLILTSLIILGLVRTHLISNWQQSLPGNTPNYFAFNIAQTDVPSLKHFFQEHKISIEAIYPMVRGRLILLNEKPILSAVPATAAHNNALHRELNLSWMWKFPADNKIVLGKDWTASDYGKSLVSVEKKLADDLQLHLGDKLVFQIGDQRLTAVISNFRTLDWSSFHPNFFMIFPPGLFSNIPATYLTSFHLTADQVVLLNQLIQRFPNVTVIDVANILQQMQDIINKMTLAMQYLFMFALAAGVLIFMTSIQASMDERQQTYRLLRVLGASNTYIRKSILTEFVSFSVLIILTSGILGFLISALLEHFVFGMGS
ncbi:MAG: FtsX-like permease family protein [Gammaproteobacteria bacterium]